MKNQHLYPYLFYLSLQRLHICFRNLLVCFVFDQVKTLCLFQEASQGRNNQILYQIKTWRSLLRKKEVGLLIYWLKGTRGLVR